MKERFLDTLDPYADDLAAIHPALQLRVSARARRLALRQDPRTGRINLVVPKRASLKKALDFARQYQDWIDKHAGKLPETLALRDGAVIPVLGRDRAIRVDYDAGMQRTTVKLTDDEIIVHTNKDDPAPRITRFLKRLAKEEITRLAHAKAEQIGKIPAAIRIGDTVSRWGSCSQDGVLSFSWRLILAPPLALDYVVAHEVAHMVHLNHKPRFWALCEKLSADFTAGHGWMKRNAQELMRYG